MLVLSQLIAAYVHSGREKLEDGWIEQFMQRLTLDVFQKKLMRRAVVSQLAANARMRHFTQHK